MMTQNQFPEQLHYLRLKYGKSQIAVADGAGYDKSFISRLESGKRDPKRETILLLADSLGLSPDDTDKLLLSAGFMPVQATSLLSNPVLARLDDLMSTTTEDKKMLAQNMITDLIAVLTMDMRPTHAAAD